MDPHSFIARAEAQRWLGIAEKLLMGHDLVGSKTFAIRARDSDPRLEAAEQILAIADTLLAAEKRVVGNNGAQQPDYYAILQLVRFVQDTDHIASQFRRLAVMLNPHQNRFPYSDQALQLVNDAWAVLSNPMRKSMYDSELDFPPQQQMNNLGFNLEQQHHHQQHHQQHQQQHQHQQQQQHNFFSINHMGASHDQELPEPQQTFQTRVQQQHNFLSQPSPVRQEQLFQHREQEQLFQPQPQSQTQAFQISSPPHQQTRQQSQPPPPQVQPFQVTSAQTHQQTRQPSQLPKREQEQLFHHREQEQLFQPQAQLPFQVASPQHHQTRQPPQPTQSQQRIQSPSPQPQVQPFQISSPPHQQTRKQQPVPQPQVQPFQVTSSQHQQTRQTPLPQPRIQSPSPPPPAAASQSPFSWTQEPPQPSPPPLAAAPQPPFSWTQAPPQQQQQPPPTQPQPPPPQLLPQIQPQPQPPPPQSRAPTQSQTPAPQSRPQPQPQSQPPPPQPLLQQHQQHLQPQSQHPPQEQPQPQPPPPTQPQPQQQQESQQNAVPVELPTQVNSDNGVMEEEIETDTEEPAENVDDSPTFWTSCPFCFYMYEYPRIYAECTLRCDHCQRAFQAVPVPSPPPIIEGQEAYFCCWGYFPLGVSMSHLEKNNTQGNIKTWTPFSPMYNASGNNVQNQNHLNGNAAPKKNTFVNKSSGPRIHLDDDIDDRTDDVFMDVSESSDESDFDSDGERGSTRKRKMKGEPKLVSKNRAQVRGISAGDAKNGMIMNLGNGMPVQESGKEDVGGIPKRQSGRVGKELGKLDLNVEFNNNEGHGHGQGGDDNVEGNGFFEGLDEFLSSLPILSVVNEEKVKAA